MRILITGAAGFLGSHLCERLLHEGHEVTGVDDFSSGQKRNVELLTRFPRFHFVEADASRPLNIAGSLDWVMHFASPASPPRYLKLPIQTIRVNGEGSRHLLDMAVAKGAKFFLASTSEIYGDPMVHPQPETYWGNVNPVGPRSIYDEAKRYAETLTMAYQQAKGVSTRTIRIFNTYGPRMDAEDGRVVTNFIVQALRGQPLTIYGDGSQTRSFQYVDDLIEGIRRLMDVEFHQPVNLGNPEEYTMLQLAQLTQELVGSKMPLVYQPLPQDDPRQRRPDITRAKELLDWEPRVSVREGLARTIAYFRDLLEAAPR
ncbi:UDP-glucuronic acid decarboxylase family protein [uncultured Meiothermus sp.]|jgi:dTDP-glucose 4,6-dehydratase|uniref:UDP-glucuronic acid decarboxylase family protein n=1 Tax=uncultured Meiothermus sp. TaxID=157471 RepID=UPI002620E6F9|nr:UDP-glucuronic acid decarboxylase family protein [uncultured Meiothermus sp.]